ncbi:hypothetical protein KIK06_04610 [Nocardiopsis sp. EMB25]|uniref:hypothetical protein n=1 Tax=Nocardiopsis sp. EMB25 TaxID=2835867 RepID=UPI00228477BB|nr:hypothetical protein [Nocardiopsis sp. EMB25]MCY9783172.1 hypothetical protein [Nocardiopsis sp. EMB25]
MDPVIIALLSAAGGALVESMVGDAWGASKSKVSQIWKSRSKDEAPAIEYFLEKDHSDLVAVPESERESAAENIKQIWTDRFIELARKDPSVVQEISSLMRHLNHINKSSTASFNATSNGSGSIYQSARDMHFGRGSEGE